ncbi:choline dehydrogenase [Pseudomonas sp. B21-056]|jgi:choline dehydrogenase|uniref:choline dehydrogenase n=1 Tax=Pseudomonas sp. B21-056 TaxID=2895495 RepID=UPI00223263D5|nr:choline dehydrogenase [Pseudomonas sp. B21-056]UZE26074.1 choline dehydrogenase [Pseudomonas sp. B21-056]
MTEFDYVIAGAGSAGCVLARRLSDAGHKVLLLEVGPSDKSWIIRMPAGLRSAFKPSSKYNWWYYTEEQAHLNKRRIQQPRGRVLGGSSSINGMTWLRGHPMDYDRWETEGAKGWSWADCAPYFKKIESSVVSSSYRGQDGPIRAQRQEKLSPLNAAFLDAGQQAGVPLTSDVNGYQQEGVSRFEMSVRDGIRNSAAYGYLHAMGAHPNLTIWLGCEVQKVTLEGRRATGFEVRYKNRLVKVRTRREAIVSCGVFGSAQLLMLSGIGPADHLREHGIECRVDLPGVGQNLQDHLECHIQIETKEPISLNRELQPHRMLWAGAQWFGLKKGVASVNQCHVGAFLNSSAATPHPDIQFHFFPVFFDKNWIPVSTTYGYRIGVGPMRPTSRGTVRLRSAKVSDPLLIDPNYMATDEDWRVMREAMRLGIEFANQPALKRYNHREDTPGTHIRSGKAMDEFIREDAASAYHPCGTCKMGQKKDPMAVVDSQLRVLGVDNLRVIDASVFPSVPSANINAATIMLAEKASDILLKRPALQPEALPFHSQVSPSLARTSA